MTEENKFISQKKAADRAGVSRQTIITQRKKGSFDATLNNKGHWQIEIKSFESWLETRENKSVRKPKADSVDDTVAYTVAQVTELQIENKVLEAKVEATTQRAERAEALVDKLMQPFWKRWRS